MKAIVKVFGIFAIAAVMVLGACGDPPADDPINPSGNIDLSGDISISPDSGVTVGMQLTAIYSGSMYHNTSR